MTDIYFQQMKLGPMENFVYLIGCSSKRECIVVDPAWDIKAIQDQLAQDDIKLVSAVVTHYHPDHCGGHLGGHDIPGVSELVGAANIPVHINRHELEGMKQVTGLSNTDLECHDSGDTIKVGDVEIQLIHTPGHTPGSQCVLVRDQLIAGDTLFLTGCGRVDLPGGDSEALFESLHQKLSPLDGQTIIYPGHDYDKRPFASLNDVKKINPYLQAKTKEQWHNIR
jgi:hydroxyacylglutathione hydrolase